MRCLVDPESLRECIPDVKSRPSCTGRRSDHASLALRVGNEPESPWLHERVVFLFEFRYSGAKNGLQPPAHRKAGEANAGFVEMHTRTLSHGWFACRGNVISCTKQAALSFFFFFFKPNKNTLTVLCGPGIKDPAIVGRALLRISRRRLSDEPCETRRCDSTSV